MRPLWFALPALALLTQAGCSGLSRPHELAISKEPIRPPAKPAAAAPEAAPEGQMAAGRPALPPGAKSGGG